MMEGISTCIFTILCFVSGIIGKTGFGPGEQEWGFVRVRPGAHMFWWLYYTTANVKSYYDRPLIIWLQGGPGVSSTAYGNFEELGPLDTDLNPRNYTWVKNYNVLFIDNPVGTGFSFVEDVSDFATTNNQIAIDLMHCVNGFYLKYPKFRPVPTYIVSESYGGKMGTLFALLWNQGQKIGAFESNLKGIALGDPWISPIDSVMTWGLLLREMGVVDRTSFKKIDVLAKTVSNKIKALQWSEATEYWVYTQNLINNITYNVDFCNILTKTDYTFSHLLPKNVSAFDAETIYKRFIRLETQLLENLMNGPVKKALGLNINHGSQSSFVFRQLRENFMTPATDYVERLLNDTDLQVFVYNGQLDLSTTIIGTLRWVDNLKWTNARAWQDSDRKLLISNNVIEGYFKTYDKFWMYWVNRAGRMVPKDNPAAMEIILQDLIRNANVEIKRR